MRVRIRRFRDLSPRRPELRVAFRRWRLRRSQVPFGLHPVHAFQSRIRDAQQISRGKFDRLPHATAEFTTSVLDGYGLHCQWPARPAPYASNPVLVHRLVRLLHASSGPRLATTPLRFAITSPPSGCERDYHPRAVEHARHTTKRGRKSPALFYILSLRTKGKRRPYT